MVISIVGELAGTEPEVEGQLVTVPISDPALLPRAVRRLDDAGVVMTELALRSPSLNEVFLSLTGHPAEEDSDDSASDDDRDRDRDGSDTALEAAGDQETEGSRA